MKNNEYAINAMRTAIINQSLNGANRAITKDDAEKSGATEERWTQWKLWVADLRLAACEYGDLQADRNYADGCAALKMAENAVWKRWRSILKVGEENLFHPNMFIRRTDVEKITTFASNVCYVYVPGKGKVSARTGENAFRKYVEQFLATRIAGNEILSDADRDVIKGYNSAVSAEKKWNDVLSGYTAGDKMIMGLYEQKEAAEKKVAEISAALESAGVGADVIKNVTAPQTEAMKKIVDDIKTAEKNKATAEKTQAELKEKYDAISALLNKIEGVEE